MKKFFAVLTGVALAATMAVGFVGCGGNGDDDDDKGNNEKLTEGMFDIKLSTGLDTRLKLEIKDGGYLITYSDIARNEYIAVSSYNYIDFSEKNIFTIEYENKGRESVYASLQFKDYDGSDGYAGGDLAAGEKKTDVVNLTECHRYSDKKVPLKEVSEINMFFDSGWSQIQDLNLYSGTIFIKSIKLSYEEPPKGPELPDESYNKLSTAMGDLFDPSAWEADHNLTTDNDTKTITRTVAADTDGDYGAEGQAYLNITDFSAQCEKIVITLGADTKCNMIMIQLQDDGEIVKLIRDSEPTQGETKLIIDLTAEQATRFVASSKQYFVIWLDANSGNGTGKLVIENVEFYTTQEIQEQPEQPEQPEEPSGNKLATTMGDLWLNGATTLFTDNDTKTITRVTAAGTDGDYGNCVALNIEDFDTDCRKIVFTLGAGTSYNMIMIQLQNSENQEIVNKNDVAANTMTITIELTAEKAQQFASSSKQFFLIWLDANSGNGTGTLVIEKVEFFGADSEESEEPEPDDNKLSTTMGDLWANSATTLSTNNDTKTITRTEAAGESGDYGNCVALNIEDFDTDCRKIVFTLGAGTSCNMIMIQVQDGSGAIIDQNWGTSNGGTTLEMTVTEEQAQRIANSPMKYFMIWLDANSGNGTGTLVIEKVEFFGATAE